MTTTPTVHLLLLTLILAGACTGDAPPAAEAGGATPTPKVLVIGIDGVRADVLAEVPTPHLDGLKEGGTFTDRARTGLPTVSGPGWSSFLTGVWPDKHGVTDNTFEGKRYDAFPDFLTRIEEVRPELNTFAVADWLPLVRADDGRPTISDRVNVKHVLDGYELGWAEADSMATELAVRHIRESDPDAMFVYLGDPDETSHRTGSIGAEYRAAIARADEQVGRLLDAARARPTYAQERWLVVVSTDHGRTAEGGHGGDTPEERTIFFLVGGPGASGEPPPDSVGIVDVAVTALTHLGISIDPAWELDGRAVGVAR